MVIAALTALAAFAAPQIYVAEQRSHMAQSSAYIRDWAMAVEDYARRHGTYPRAGYTGPVEGLASLFPKHPPLADGWGNPILYHASKSVYALRCTGRDGKNDHQIMRGSTTSYDDDILFVNGGFTRANAGLCGGAEGDDWDVKKFGECASCHPHRVQTR